MVSVRGAGAGPVLPGDYPAVTRAAFSAVMGVTGARASTSELAGPLVARAKATTDLPIGVGLGVSNGEQAAEEHGPLPKRTRR